MSTPAPQPAADRAPPARGLARRAVRIAWRLTRLPMALTLGLLVVLSAFQERLIFPGAATQGDPSAEVSPPPGAELVRLTTAHGDRVVALFGPALTPDGRPRHDAARRPTILYFYGNGMCLRDTADEFASFRSLGANVMVAEYVGYGLSGGKASEAGCVATADAAYDHLVQRPDVDPSKIVAAGRSLGGAVAIDLAARRPVAELVTLCTFTRLLDLAKLHYAFAALPARVLLKHRFESLSKIGRVRCPILLIHGTDDRLVPFAMSTRLASAATAPVTRVAIEGAGHNDLFAIGEDQILDALRKFLEPLASPGD